MPVVERSNSFRALEDGEVHLWTSDLMNYPHVHPADLETLDPDEQHRAGKIIVPRGRERYVASHLFLRRTLAQYASVAPERISFQKDSRGKPSLAPAAADNSHVRAPLFSFSHSRDSAALAVSASCEVGVDIEFVRQLDELEQLSNRFLSRDEKEYVLDTLVNEERHARFFRVWARKEAVLKALGRGITVALSTFSALGDNATAPDAVTRLPPELFHRDGEIVFVCDASAPPGYSAAVASVRPIRSLVFMSPEGP